MCTADLSRMASVVLLFRTVSPISFCGICASVLVGSRSAANMIDIDDSDEVITTSFWGWETGAS